MKRQRIFNLKSGENSNEINLSPLIDLIFILLIFFIVTAAFIHETGIKASTPVSSRDKMVNEKVPIVLKIQKSGMITCEGEKMTMINIESFIASQVYRNRQDVIIQTEKGTTSKLAIQLMDMSYVAGAKSVKIAP